MFLAVPTAAVFAKITAQTGCASLCVMTAIISFGSCTPLGALWVRPLALCNSFWAARSIVRDPENTSASSAKIRFKVMGRSQPLPRTTILRPSFLPLLQCCKKNSCAVAKFIACNICCRPVAFLRQNQLGSGATSSQEQGCCVIYRSECALIRQLKNQL